MAKSAATKKSATKSTAKKAAKPATQKTTAGKDKPIKYTDKSPGQPQLTPIFAELKKLLLPYLKKGTLVERGDQPGGYSLWVDKPAKVAEGKIQDVFFAGLLIQKGYVGFYFMPVYANPAMKSQMHPDLVKCLKGKSCFHIKKNNPELMLEVKEALKMGYEDFKKKGWV
ncbi:MAG: hypothetical protein WCF67_05410 [Chitinophagaceae bacterium]